MNRLYIPYILLIVVFATLLPHAADAKTLEISGWIPYWRAATGTSDTILHLNSLTEVNPFGYSVKNDGTLADTLHIDEAPWKDFISAAKAKKVRVIPTVMWSDGEAIHRILSDGVMRRALEDEIADLVKTKGFDGIDLDFEGKKAETKDYFSTFLKGLYMRMGKKWVMCTIEARTPLTSRYDTIPKDIQYANDYVAINKYCDRVRLMTYDQGSIDLRLNDAVIGPYVPISDPKWIEKVVNLTAKTISKKKLVIGIATYGYEYDVTPLSEGYKYDLLWAFNPRYATELATQLSLTAKRNEAGELSISYVDMNSTPPTTSSGTDTIQSNNPNAGQVLGAATILPTTFRLAWWSDSVAIKSKIALAKKLGVRGVAIFKLDGGEDPGIWGVLK